MKRLIVCFMALLCSTVVWAKAPRYNIIPQPNQIINVKGEMKIDGSETVTLYLANEELKSEMEFLEQFLASKKIPFKRVDGDEPKGNKLCAIILKIQPEIIHSERYRLRIAPRRALLEGSTPQAVFYGMQSLMQLINASEGSIPCGDIQDAPRFRWRGFMLDESRHFFGMEYVKRTLDMMAYFKLNRFHWHLTDSPAWRIEIKKYPRLTTVGSSGCHCFADSPVKKFYTQEQIREIVAYAAKRHITIIPEIDMPGHATAANTAYPEYSGGPLERFSHFTFNVGLDATYGYLTDILREVASLFPSKMIHLGGDEVSFGIKAWEKNADVQRLMKDKGFTDLRQAEQYFLKRMIDSIHSLGLKVAGWDELVENKISNKATIFWWRHEKYELLQNALEGDHRVVLCPRDPYYLDFIQHETHQSGRRKAGGSIRVNTLVDGYLFPESLYPNLMVSSKALKRVYGVQANMWSEQIATHKRADFMAWPRLCAVAESGWSRAEVKNFEDFEARMEHAYKYLDSRDVYYYDYRDINAHPEIRHEKAQH